MATSTMAEITTQKYTSSVKRPSLKFIPITPASRVARENQHRHECEHLHDLVRPLPGAREEDVERPDDRLTAVTSGLNRRFEAVTQCGEALRGARARDRVQLGPGQRTSTSRAIISSVLETVPDMADVSISSSSSSIRSNAS